MVELGLFRPDGDADGETCTRREEESLLIENFKAGWRCLQGSDSGGGRCVSSGCVKL